MAFPYALPNLMSAGFLLMSALGVVLGLEEVRSQFMAILATLLTIDRHSKLGEKNPIGALSLEEVLADSFYAAGIRDTLSCRMTNLLALLILTPRSKPIPKPIHKPNNAAHLGDKNCPFVGYGLVACV